MANKNKSSTLAQLVADSEPVTKQVSVGDHIIEIRELTGRERFELAEKESDPRWDTMLWLCMKGMTQPTVESTDELEQLRPEWIAEIATAIMGISGVTEEAVEAAGKESENVTAIGGS